VTKRPIDANILQATTMHIPTATITHDKYETQKENGLGFRIIV